MTSSPPSGNTTSEDGTARSHLLFLSQVLPFPPDGGVKIRTYHTLRLLSTEFDVTALCFYRTKGGLLQQDVEASIQALQAFGRVYAFPLPQERGKVRFIWDHARSVLTRRVYTVYTYDSSVFLASLSKALSDRSFALVHADSLDLSRYFPLLGHLPLVCAHHDAQSTLLRRRADREGSYWRASYFLHQAKLMRREEERWCPRVALNITVSEDDRQALQAVAPAGEFAVVPNGVDTSFFQPSPKPPSSDDIVFVGGTTWFPNLDALRYYRDAILPLIRKHNPSCNTTWVGRATSDEQASYGAVTGLSLTGYVDDIRPYVHRAACYIVPLRVGGGTRLKILDAWAMGKAVVSTSLGCEGLAAHDGRNILIRDDPDSFATAVHQVLSSPDLRDRLGREGRRTATEVYSWEVVGAGMLPRYRALLSAT